MNQEKPVWKRRDECDRFERIVREGKRNIVVFDLETTGTDKRLDRIVQISAYKVSPGPSGYQITGSLNEYVNPGIPMNPKASQVNHITDDMLQDKPTESGIAEKVHAFFGSPENTIYTGYNIRKFDVFFMDGLYRRAFGTGFPCEGEAILDTKDLAEELLERKKIVQALQGKSIDGHPIDENDLSQHPMRLVFVADYLNLIPKGTLHDSDTDTKLTGAVLWKLLDLHLRTSRTCKDELTRKSRIELDYLWRAKYAWNSDYVFFRVHVDAPQRIRYQIHYDRFNKKYVDDGMIIENAKTQIRSRSVFEIGDMWSFTNYLKSRFGDFSGLEIKGGNV